MLLGVTLAYMPVAAMVKQIVTAYQQLAYAPSPPQVQMTVSAVPPGPSAPTGFTATFIAPRQVELEWTKGLSTNNTKIVAKFFEYPISKDDGYVVYYGMGESVNDTALDLDITFGSVFYRAYSENTTGGWSINYAEASTENPEMEGIVEQLTQFNNILASLISLLLVLALAIFAHWRGGLLYILSGLAFIVYGFSLWSTSTYLSILLVVAGAYMFAKAIWSRKKAEE